ncbi:MAG: class II fructose-bisphosphate aldolase [Caldilineaceae bacterium]|nr:class II fructose-bisphosphate aldolase [Caldilineaceae bacterium]
MNAIDMIRQARSRQWAVGEFNISNLETLQAIVAAANAQRSPVIVGVSMGSLRHIGLSYLRGLVEAAKNEADVPLYFHLDHGANFDAVRSCIEIGFDSVMIDASRLPMDENIAAVRRVADYAHARNVGVEAQIGETWDEESGEQITVKTDPAEAAEFVARTGIDYLAISFGNTPGRLQGKAEVDVDLVRRVADAIDLPIVLHGGTSIPDAELRQALKFGAAKVNIDTALRQAVIRTLHRAYCDEEPSSDPRKAFADARQAVQEVVAAKMDLFGSAGRAG